MDSKVLFEDDVAKIQQYLQLHPDHINMSNATLDFSDTPLMHAVRSQRVDVVDCLIANHCNINLQNDFGETALHIACDRDYINRDIIERLIANGATGVIPNNIGNTPLHIAAYHCEDVNIIHLLTIVCNCNDMNDYGNNPLMKSCIENKNIEIIRALANLTININQQAKRGNTALHACCCRDDDAFKFLLSEGADPYLLDEDEYSSYDFASAETKKYIDDFMMSPKSS